MEERQGPGATRPGYANRPHLIDRIDALVPGRALRARKLTSYQETYWRDEGAGPQLPAPLLLEALCQAGGWLVMGSTGLSHRAEPRGMAGVRLLGAVRPGDVLEVEVSVVTGPEEEDDITLSGSVRTGGRAVLTAEAVGCALVRTEGPAELAALREMYERLIGDVQPLPPIR
ncbi:hypothetical protein ACZ90_69415 [Streptomyces albus subsp. albus]|nr:hypothetical protein ACZ90_69415 [Streptomyces albus subsp. albus]